MATHPANVVSPLAIDLFCGLGGWTDGLLAEGYYVVGFDVERHDYGKGGYPAQLVLQDVLTLHGKQFKDAALIVASPPCQEYSYMAMPWSKAKAIAAQYRSGARDTKKLTALFDACFRIQREACEAAGRHIPTIVENVRGAIPWVGRSRWNYGSYHLWGDVPALMPMTKKILKGGWRSQANGASMRRDDSCKVPGFRFDGSGGSFQTAATAHTGVRKISEAHRSKSLAKGYGIVTDDGIKQGGISGIRANGKGNRWFQDGAAQAGSKSKSRKAASAAIAKIPFPLAQYIAAHFKPSN